MAQKRKNHQTKLDRARALLLKLEADTAKAVKKNLGANWRDNLFEILMTRIELARKNKAAYLAIPTEIGANPVAIPRFLKLGAETMERMLTLAKAPATPVHVALFGAIYVHVIYVFLNDDSRDLSKTMAAIDRDLGHFENMFG
jgi:ubiquinone biosynthesis protein COQ9